MSQRIAELDRLQFDTLIATSTIPVLVDFWGYGCPPCDLLAPVLEQLAGEYSGRVRVAKINAQDHPAVAARFGITSVPTLLLVQNQEVTEQVAGLYPISLLRQMLEARLAPSR